MWALRYDYGGVPFTVAFQNVYQEHNAGVTHEFKYKMNEFILNFPETLGFLRLEYFVFLPGLFIVYFSLVALSLRLPQASLGS